MDQRLNPNEPAGQRMSRKRCVVVTGASSGIGQAVSDLLLTQGHEVIGISRQPERSVAHENYAAFPFDLRHISEMPQMGNHFYKHTPTWTLWFRMRVCRPWVV